MTPWYKKYELCDALWPKEVLGLEKPFVHVRFSFVVKLQEDLEKSQIETDKSAFLLSELEKEKTSEVSSQLHASACCM